MSATLDHFQTTSQGIVNLAAMSLSAAPDLTDDARATRFQTVAGGTLEFAPADPAQTILASLILSHFLAVMDGLRDIACLTLTPAEAARARIVTVTQTKLLLQLLRELRMERKEALTRAVAEPAAEPVGDVAFDAPLARFLSAHTEVLSALANTDPLTPAAAVKAREALVQAMGVQAKSGVANSVAGEVTGSRAERRAMMKRNGAFKRRS